ncbi:ComEC/Rec2 family competence protein [Canibacter sp. lx-72]|uniref:ComEC/Rec2 family competence protein n=1 Tax=Canibacter zhuwentaonis TaxID=2837491 RepID=UPI001BDD9187|nr:ComEC/Rec2 family competence protein [Canibacter zhuwentaonis]MBT1017905.1 ComEC/Rec2 family competence protein [Canibacter zhuwentaonis]
MRATHTLKTARSVTALQGVARLMPAAVTVWGAALLFLLTPGSSADFARVTAVIAVVTVVVLIFLLWRIGRFACRRATVSISSVKLYKILPAFVIALAMFALLATHLCAQLTAREHLQEQLSDGIHELELQLVEYPKTKLNEVSSVRYMVAKITGVVQKDKTVRTVPSGVRVRVWLRDAPLNKWAPGSDITVFGRLQKQPLNAAEGFTLQAQKITDSTRGADSTLGIDLTRGTGSKHSVGVVATLQSQLAVLRYQLRERSSKQPGAQLLPGFAIGDTSLLDPQLAENMQTAGLTHLTAVSGGNCALVIAAASVIASRAGVPRSVRIFLMLGALLLFALLVGPDSSLARAAVMAGVLLLAKFGSVKSAGITALSVAVIVLIIYDPWQALKPGFALSVAATLGILVGSPVFQTLFTGLKLPQIVALPLAVTVAAQIACAPILLFLQENVSLVGVFANLVAAPIAPWLTGMGLLAVIAIAVIPMLAGPIIFVAAIFGWVIAKIAWVCSQIPGGSVSWQGGFSGFLTMLIAQTALLLAWRYREYLRRLRSGAHPWVVKYAPSLKQRILIASGYLLAGVIIAINTIIAPVSAQLSVPKNWIVAGCDIGQGDAVMVRDPAYPDAVMLIDTGENPELLKKCFETFGVQHLALIMLTHDDKDHVGAVHVAAERGEYALIAPPTTEQKRTGKRTLLTTLKRLKLKSKYGVAGMSGVITKKGEILLRAAGDETAISWQILAPDANKADKDTNAISQVAIIHVAGLKILMLADTGRKEQTELLAKYPAAMLRADVLKVAHHGSKNQDPLLTRAVQAKWGIIGVGARNKYGHPSRETLRSLHDAGTNVLRTDIMGAVAITADEQNRVWQQRVPENIPGVAITGESNRVKLIAWERRCRTKYSLLEIKSCPTNGA